MEYFKKEIVTALAVFVGALLVLFYLIPHYIELPQEYAHVSLSPAFFPRLATCFIAGLALLYLIHNFILLRARSPYQGPKDWISGSEERMAYVCSLVIIVYLPVLKYIGFLISTILILTLLLVLQKVRGPIKVALISIGVTIGVYVFFLYVMNIHFPAGIIFE